MNNFEFEFVVTSHFSWLTQIVYIIFFNYLLSPLKCECDTHDSLKKYTLRMQRSDSLLRCWTLLFFSSYKTKTGKNRSIVEALRPLFPLVAFIALSFYWIRSSPNNVLMLDPRAVFITTGTIFSNICVSSSVLWDPLWWCRGSSLEFLVYFRIKGRSKL